MEKTFTGYANYGVLGSEGHILYALSAFFSLWR